MFSPEVLYYLWLITGSHCTEEKLRIYATDSNVCVSPAVCVGLLLLQCEESDTIRNLVDSFRNLKESY